MPKRRFALIGPGRVGTGFAYLLRMQGLELRAVVGRSESSLQRAKVFLEAGGEMKTEFTTEFRRLPEDVDFILLGVRDDQIAEVVQTLWQEKKLRHHQIVVHFSGAHAADVGQTAKMADIGRLALHPLQAVADVEAGILKLPESVWSIEGNAEGIALGEELLNQLQFRFLKITKEQKALYHAAACVVSNYLVTLTQISREMLTSVGFPPELAQEALLPLIQGTIDNLRVKEPKVALTGPIARADVSTIEKHLKKIQEINEEWLAPYIAMGEATLRYADISTEDAEQISKKLKGV